MLIQRTLIASNKHLQNASSCAPVSQQIRNIVQRKIDLTWNDPFDMLADYKKRMAEVKPTYLEEEGAPKDKVIVVENEILKYNIRQYEDLQKAGKYPFEGVVSEEPSVQEYIDWLKKGKPKAGEWNPDTCKRVGLLGVKIGMMVQWDNYMERIPLTLIQIPTTQVVQIKTKEKEGYNALQIGVSEAKIKNVLKPQMGHFAKAGVDPKSILKEFPVSEDCILPVGTSLNARHFSVGQYVDITGVTKGKGFQGAMKRWGFAGLRASHGVSAVHRSIGSTSSGGMSKVFKGKKMPGHMGNHKRTQFNNFIYMIDVVDNVLFVKGSIPGPNGQVVILRDADRKPPSNPAYPTFYPPENEDLSKLNLFQGKFDIYKRPKPPAFWKEATEVSELEVWKSLVPILAENQKDAVEGRRFIPEGLLPEKEINQIVQKYQDYRYKQTMQQVLGGEKKK